MKQAPICKTCGTPLEDIPFKECPEHREYEANLPPLTEEEKKLLSLNPFEGEY